MRRQKRDKSNRAYVRGYQAGVGGRSRELCPFNDVATRQHWLNGWRDGRADLWSGMAGIAGLHKVANM
jgi:ribosome modulation factor